MKDFNELLGHTIIAIKQDAEDSIVFELASGYKCTLYHEQDCCESVYIDTIQGTLQDLVGSPLIEATETGSDDPPPKDKGYDSYTWTIYTLATAKHRVVIRWFGESNGYYSEDVRFVAKK